MTRFLVGLRHSEVMQMIHLYFASQRWNNFVI
jgi:hypothetical protein